MRLSLVQNLLNDSASCQTASCQDLTHEKITSMYSKSRKSHEQSSFFLNMSQPVSEKQSVSIEDNSSYVQARSEGEIFRKNHKSQNELPAFEKQLTSNKTTLSEQFKAKVSQMITFRHNLPYSIDKEGEIMLSDGIFHEMWLKILLRVLPKEEHQQFFLMYYEAYFANISQNRLKFNEFFRNLGTGGCMNSKEESTQSNSNPKRVREPEDEPQQQLEISVDLSCSVPYDAQKKTLTIFSPRSGRLRLAHAAAQVNERRMWAEMACLVLNISHACLLDQVVLTRILEDIRTERVEMILVEGHVSEFVESEQRWLALAKPRLLLGAYRLLGIEQLLRIQKTYGRVYGILVYQDVDALDKWIASSHFYTQDSIKWQCS